MKESCGVFGVWVKGGDAAHLTCDGLFALQHRGQEAAGIAASDGESLAVLKDNGMVMEIFNEPKIVALPGSLAIGHTRYSTQGSTSWSSAQPVYRPTGDAGFALVHNGSLTNTQILASSAGLPEDHGFSDSEVVAELLDQSAERTMRGALAEFLPGVEGAFAFVLLERDRIYGIRDRYGLRPLCIGRIGSPDHPEGWVLASETVALDIVGAAFVRDVTPGELVTISEDGLCSEQLLVSADVKEKLCAFEFVYCARPDSYLHGQSVHGVRRRMGELLAQQAPVGADLVMGVPDSGNSAAEGYAESSGIPYRQGLVKNRYIARTFIEPSQDMRVRSVQRKLNVLRDSVDGSRLVVVDDSIVRGNTTRVIVTMLRDAGAVEVHLRISSPPVQWPCFYGIDTPDREHLLAANHSLREMAELLGADSLEFITVENLHQAINGGRGGLCDACMTGNYPTPVPVTLVAVGGALGQ